MGFFEDDRVRSKNAVHNLAYDEYTRLKDGGLSNDEIKELCKGHIMAHPTSTRNDIFLTIVKIVGGYTGENTTN